MSVPKRKGGDPRGPSAETTAGTHPDTDTTVPPDPVTQPDPPPPQNVRFFGSIRLNPERYARDLTRVAQEVIQHLAAEGVDLHVTVDVSATKPDGFGDDKVRIVTENARTLKFDQFGFEND